MARVAETLGVPLIMGALTPTEVGRAVDLGAAAVKIFPARIGGPAYFATCADPSPTYG